MSTACGQACITTGPTIIGLLLSSRREPEGVGVLPTQTWDDDAAVVVFMTAVFARVQWRYGLARAYRGILAEAGHLAQTFCVIATRLGLAPFCSMALADAMIEQDLGIDGVSESVVYAAGVGMPSRSRVGAVAGHGGGAHAHVTGVGASPRERR